MGCPACGSTRLGQHSSYQKYLYEQLITILRLRCRGCGRTHAVIPSWSLPDTSVGSAEVERYLLARERGVSRAVALEELRARGNARRLRQATGAPAGCHREPRQGAVAAGGGPATWRLGVDPSCLRTAACGHPAAEPQPLLPGAPRERAVLFPHCDLVVRTASPTSTEAALCPVRQPPRSLWLIIPAPRRHP